MSKYLYGASVQGIQEFIFKTNKLQEIVGASEIVKNITEDFKKKFEKNPNVNILLCAAGNIKAIFDNKYLLQTYIEDFEKNIMQKAYGITISQSVVKIDTNYTQEDIDKLEKNLKIQRNKPSIPLDSSINIIKLSSKTAKPEVQNDKDKATLQKEQAYANWFQEKQKENPKFKNYKEISALSNGKNKIAVIHIDGNGLGQIVPKLGNKLSSFSLALDNATKKAYEEASQGKTIRDIILGGDDLTVIINANDALKFVQKFLENFEKESSTIQELKGIQEKLTACAGVAFCNEKYPFHYAVNLAEALCSEAKKHSDRSSSCMMFHNIQSSNYQSWSKFVEDELTIINDKGPVYCDFGPYYLDSKTKSNISDFLNSVEAYACEGSPIGRLRNWLSEFGKSSKYSTNLLKRINKMAEQNSQWNSCIMNKNLKKFDKKLSNEKLIIKKDRVWKTPIYDILQILSVTEAR